MDRPTLKVKKLTPTATLPSRGSVEAAGLDLYLDEATAVIHGGMRALLSTGIAMAIPKGYYGRVAPRSGLAVKQGIDVLAGVIDSDYRGEVKVALINTDKRTAVFKQGERVAQIIIEKIAIPFLDEVNDLDDTERGAAGYGSTGA